MPAPTFGSIAEVNGTTGNSVTFAYAVTTGNLLLLRTAISTVTTPPSSIAATYGGQAMTLVPNTSYNNASQINTSIWYLEAPPAGTANVVVTWGGTTNRMKMACHQVFNGGVPVYGATQNQTDGTLDLNMTTAVGHVVVDIVARGTSAATLTPVSGQTSQWNTLTNSVLLCAGSYIVSTGATQMMSWDLSSASALSMSACSIPYQEPVIKSGFFHFF